MRKAAAGVCLGPVRVFVCRGERGKKTAVNLSSTERITRKSLDNGANLHLEIASSPSLTAKSHLDYAGDYRAWSACRSLARCA